VSGRHAEALKGKRGGIMKGGSNPGYYNDRDSGWKWLLKRINIGERGT